MCLPQCGKDWTHIIWKISVICSYSLAHSCNINKKIQKHEKQTRFRKISLLKNADCRKLSSTTGTGRNTVVKYKKTRAKINCNWDYSICELYWRLQIEQSLHWESQDWSETETGNTTVLFRDSNRYNLN